MRGFGIGLFLLLAAAAPPGTPPETPEPLLAPGSWTVQTSGTTNALNGVSFVNSTEGFAVGAVGTIRRTTDGGATACDQSSVPVAVSIEWTRPSCVVTKTRERAPSGTIGPCAERL